MRLRCVFLTFSRHLIFFLLINHILAIVLKIYTILFHFDSLQMPKSILQPMLLHICGKFSYSVIVWYVLLNLKSNQIKSNLLINLYISFILQYIFTPMIKPVFKHIAFWATFKISNSI